VNWPVSIDRLTLERRQVFVYLVSIICGLALGTLAPGLAPFFERLLWPLLGILLYATFVQVPLLHVRAALRDGRFIAAILLGNFVLVPLLVWAILPWLPVDPALRFGVALVLLVPCTDWFNTFTYLGGGDAPRAIAVTPLNLLLQLALAPLYLWLLLGSGSDLGVNARHLLPAAIGLIGVPLLLAALTQRFLEARPAYAPWHTRLALTPVPLLALVVFFIAAAQVDAVRGEWAALLAVMPAYVVFLLAATFIARALAGLLRLPVASGRTLAFSLATRNSFVVLPVALALPAGWEVAVVVIVVQSLVELFGVSFLLWFVPKRLFPG
jgi:ACR3 family arsenite efflux pump ArsB